MNNRPVELEVKHLCKFYNAGKHRTLKAVDDVSFVIHKGETLHWRVDTADIWLRLSPTFPRISAAVDLLGMLLFW